MSLVQERYTAVICPLNVATPFQSNGSGGFLALTTGTITLERLVANSVYDVIVTGLPVTAGIYTPLPFYLSHLGGRLTTAGGASGVLAVD